MEAHPLKRWEEVKVALDDETESRLLDRVEYVEEAVTVLASKQSLAPEDYRANREQRAIVEREFQTAIEACIDIAGILIAALDEPMPETNADRFVRLIELDLLTEDPGRRMRTLQDFGMSSHINTVTSSTTIRSFATCRRNSTYSSRSSVRSGRPSSEPRGDETAADVRTELAPLHHSK